MTEKLDTKLWLEAHLRQIASRGQSYYIVHKGDSARGSVVLKLNSPLLGGSKLLSQAYDEEGEPAWLPALGGKVVTESEADAYLARLISRDSDVWVVEIDSPDGTHPFPGKLLL